MIKGNEAAYGFVCALKTVLSAAKRSAGSVQKRRFRQKRKADTRG